MSDDLSVSMNFDLPQGPIASTIQPGIDSAPIGPDKPTKKPISKTKQKLRRIARRHSALQRGVPKFKGGRCGRPPKILETPQRMAELGREYFHEREHPCLAGLIMYLGLSGYNSFYSYMDRPEYHDVAKKLHTEVMAKMEEVSIYGNSSGARHALNNYSRWSTRDNGVWRNETDVTVNTSEPARRAHDEFRSLPKELRQEYISVLKKIDAHQRIATSKPTTASEIHPTSIGAMVISQAINENEDV